MLLVRLRVLDVAPRSDAASLRTLLNSLAGEFEVAARRFVDAGREFVDAGSDLIVAARNLNSPASAVAASGRSKKFKAKSSK
jgi:hypothetical protein